MKETVLELCDFIESSVYASRLSSVGSYRTFKLAVYGSSAVRGLVEEMNRDSYERGFVLGAIFGRCLNIEEHLTKNPGDTNLDAVLATYYLIFMSMGLKEVAKSHYKKVAGNVNGFTRTRDIINEIGELDVIEKMLTLLVE